MDRKQPWTDTPMHLCAWKITSTMTYCTLLIKTNEFCCFTVMIRVSRVTAIGIMWVCGTVDAIMRHPNPHPGPTLILTVTSADPRFTLSLTVRRRDTVTVRVSFTIRYEMLF